MWGKLGSSQQKRKTVWERGTFRVEDISNINKCPVKLLEPIFYIAQYITLLENDEKLYLRGEETWIIHWKSLEFSHSI